MMTTISMKEFLTVPTGKLKASIDSTLHGTSAKEFQVISDIFLFIS